MKNLDVLASEQASPADPRWLELCLIATGLRDGLGRTDLGPLRKAVEHLAREFPERYSRGPEFLRRIAECEGRVAESGAALARGDEGAAERAAGVFSEVERLRREALLANPLLDFTDILFVKRSVLPPSEDRGNHMCDQYFGFHARGGGEGGLFVLEDAFGDSPRLRDVLADSVCESGRMKGRRLEGGGFLSPDLSWDGRRILFAWTEGEPTRYRWTERSTFHVFKVNVDGTGLEQLTDGPWNDFDPCWLPDGRIVFISERRGGYGRCHGRPVPTFTLHSMNADGSGIECISYHETNEWHPSVDANGMIAFTRWDYVDRDSDVAHHLWICYPDGRDPRSYHGNYPVKRENRPWMEMSPRAVPGSHKYVAVAAPHHGQAYGSLVLIDHRPEDDNAVSQIERLTPEVRFPESEGPSGGKAEHVYATPWPLSEDFHLCVYDAGSKNHGIYLIDSFGNRMLIYRDPKVGCLEPIPLQQRPVPPVIPSLAAPVPADAPPTGTVAVMNVYDSDFKWPEGAEVKALRIVQLFPKATPRVDDPRIGAADQSLARGVVGTVPVERDGSAYFEMPANVPVYFQALDGRGLAIQSMRSDAFVHAGTKLVCQGCHEPKRRAPAKVAGPLPDALRRAPSKVVPDVDGSYPVLYPRLVQGVLDRNCVGCHAKKPKAPDLTGAPSGRHGWSRSFERLHTLGYARHGGNGAIRRNLGSRSVAGEVGAMASELFKMLDGGHNDLELAPEDLYRITLWIDCNTNFYGAYHDLQKQARGEVVMPDLK